MDKDTEVSVFTAANYHNRFKMSRHRFEFITEKIRFNNIPTAAESEMASNSPSFYFLGLTHEIQPVIEAFNER